MPASAPAALPPLFVPDYLYQRKHHSGHYENNNYYFNYIHFTLHTPQSLKMPYAAKVIT